MCTSVVVDCSRAFATPLGVRAVSRFMERVRPFVLVIAAALGLANQANGADEQAEKPLSLHPDNPRYFLFRGKPAFLLTSGEHYGAVLNKDFNYSVYFDELRARGFNVTRTFSET